MQVFMKGEDGLSQYDRRGFCYTDSRDLDFGDVFGGPPSQFLMRGFSEAAAAAEPVFRGKSAARRRHLHGDDFFDDIFRGDESYSSPSGTRRHRFSFPAKSTKLVVEFPTFSSRTDHVEYKMDKSSKKNTYLSCEDPPKLEKELKSIASSSNRHHFIADNAKGDFAKIFNKEKDLRPKTYVKMQSQSCRLSTAAGIKLKENDKVNESLRKVEPEHCPPENTPSYASVDARTSKKTAAFSSESPRSDSKILGDILDDPFEDFFEFQELHDDLEKATPRSEACEDTKADAKIREWSSGKEGNIRSLLSTLQYVLWDGSEWQPIVLVDLVEENLVKRAYQKALLRLHPDYFSREALPRITTTLHSKFLIFFRRHGTISTILLQFNHCREY